MKLNWGHYIVIGFTAFVALILFMVVRSFQHKNDLVTEEYYEKELEYQEVIEKKQRASELGHEITWIMSKEGLVISYPNEVADIDGNIFLYRPSDKDLDIHLAIKPDSSHRQVIPSEDLQRGKYTLQIDWSHAGSTYFTEGVVFVSR